MAYQYQPLNSSEAGVGVVAPLDHHGALSRRPRASQLPEMYLVKVPIKRRTAAADNVTIRLLILQPGECDSDILCELRHESLASAPPYEAVSYCWGGAGDSRCIKLHGCTHKVTANLYAVLRHLRWTDRARTLWIDALCINQDDLEERASQVRIMGDIYCRADSVVSWLGAASEDSDQAMEFITNLGQLTKGDEAILSDLYELGDETIKEYFSKKGFSMSDQKWAAVWKLLERPYWTRVWIIQELSVRGMLRLSTGVLQCGTASVDRSDFDFACETIQRMISAGGRSRSLSSDTADVNEPQWTDWKRGHPPGLRMFKMLTLCNCLPLPDLEFLLLYTTYYKSSDPRDKIYAILGLTSELYRSFCQDYTKPLEIVLQDLVEFCVNAYGDLGIILGNRLRLAPYGPSWAPDLWQGMAGDPGLYLRTVGGHNADAGRAPSLEFVKDLGLLKAKGLRVAKLKEVIGPFPGNPQDENTFEPDENTFEPDENTFEPDENTFEPRELQELMYLLKAQDTMGQIRNFNRTLSPTDKETLWRTLVMDRDDSRVFADKILSPAPVEFGRMAQLTFHEQTPGDLFPDTDFPTSIDQFCAPFQRAMEVASSNRCFFTTECSHMGIGPYDTQSGDVIALLFGSPLFVILRQVGATDVYQLIGDAYFHGAMQGELVRERAEREFELLTLS